MPNIMAFTTLDGSGFLEFGVSNAKYLASDTLDGNTLSFYGNQLTKKISWNKIIIIIIIKYYFHS